MNPAPTAPAVLRDSRFALAFAGLTLVAAVLRLPGLTALLLDPDEARLAGQAWRVTSGAPVGALADPLAGGLAALATFVLGPSDLAVRLLPFLAGLAAVALCAGLTPLVGRLGALVCALALASAPVAIHTARHLGSESFALLFAILALVALGRLERGPRWAALWAGSLGALLAAGSAGVGLAIGLGVALLVSYQADWQPLGTAVRAALRARGSALFGIGAFLAASTAGLAATSSLLASGPVAWVSRFATGPTPWPSGYAALIFAVQSPGLVLLGALGAALGLRQPGFARAGLVWAATALGLLWLAPRAQPTDALTLVVPTALLGARAAAELARLAKPERPGWLDSAFACAGLAAWLVLRLATDAVLTSGPILVLGGSLGFLLVSLRRAGRSNVAPYLAGVALLLLGAAGLRSVDPAHLAPYYQATLAAPEVGRIADDLAGVVGDPHTARALVVPAGLDWIGDWYLAEYSRSGDPGIVLARPGVPAPANFTLYRRYRVSVESRPSLAPFRDAWRWLVVRQSAENSRAEEMLVYVRP